MAQGLMFDVESPFRRATEAEVGAASTMSKQGRQSTTTTKQEKSIGGAAMSGVQGATAGAMFGGPGAIAGAIGGIAMYYLS